MSGDRERVTAGEVVEALRNLAHAAVAVLSNGTSANVSALNVAQKEARTLLARIDAKEEKG